MAGFEGWWVNGRTGRGHHVSEHGMDLAAKPEQYGLTPEEVQKLTKAKGYNAGDTDPEGGRGLLLKAAMRHGWVRVRGYQGKYAIQTFGNLASLLPKTLTFLRKAGVHMNSEILLSDLSSGFSQRFEDGMSDVVRAIKQGKVPDMAPKESVSDVIKGKRQGIPTELPEKQQRVLMRQRLGQKAHVPDPSPADDFLQEEKRSLKKGLKKLLG